MPVRSLFGRGRFAVAPLVAGVLVLSSCSGSSSDAGRLDAAGSSPTTVESGRPTTTGPSDSASSTTVSQASTEPTQTTQTDSALDITDARFDAAGIGGLKAGEPPTGLGADEIAVRRTLLVTLDPAVAFEHKIPHVETGKALRSAHDGLMATIDALAGQMEMTEPDIVVSDDQAELSFVVRSPAIGEIGYDVTMRRDSRNGWVSSEDSFCDAVALSGLQCR